MGWNPDSPTNGHREALIAYLEASLTEYDATNSYAEDVIRDLKTWIAWLHGDPVDVCP